MDTLLTALKAVAEPTRLRLLALCARGELTVTDLTGILGQSQPRVSRHLRVLLEAGLLERFREQTWVYYRLPLKGDGARLARRLLRLLPADDPLLALDWVRLDQVLARRTRELDSTETRDDDGPEAHGVAGVDSRILKACGDETLGDLLDIGTGTGRMLRLLAERTETAVGIDISRDMLLLARVNLRSAGMDHLTVRQGNMYQLKFADGAFDTVTVDQVLFQAEQPESVLAEAARVLRPGGRLLLLEFLTGEPGTESAPETPITRDVVEGWLKAAGLRLETGERIDATPWPLLLSVSRRQASSRVVAA